MTAALDAIRALAAAATPGPWHESPSHDAISGQGRIGGEANEYVAYTFRGNAAYIAAVDPQTVLALIAALDRAEAMAAAARAYLRFGTHHDLDRLHDRLRAYEDADKVADG